MGYNSIDGKSNGCVGIMFSLHKQLHCVIGVVLCGKYNLLISQLGSVKLCDSLSVSCHPSPSAVGFADGFVFSGVSVGEGFVYFFCSKPTLVTQHTVAGFVKETCGSITIGNQKDGTPLGPNALKAPQQTRKELLAFLARLVEMHYILLPRQFVILVHGFSALLGFVITFK